MKLIKIDTTKYFDYKMRVIFEGYKWDNQFLDINTIAPYVLVLTKKEANQVMELTNRLASETTLAQKMLKNNAKLAKALRLPKKIKKGLDLIKMDRVNDIGLMRFDFHPVDGGWAVSEVNSDVPGGWAESSLMPKFALDTMQTKKYYYVDFGQSLANAIASKTAKGGTIAFVHCTSYSDDRQVMQFLADRLACVGYQPILCAADHLRFNNDSVFCILDGHEGRVDTIVRFTPIEWAMGLKKSRYGYFDTGVVSCNNPINFYTQTKRFPFCFEAIKNAGLDLVTWKSLLPKTVTVRQARQDKSNTEYIFKPIFGRVGEGIGIREAISPYEYKKIIKSVGFFPHKYIAQQKFVSRPLSVDGKDFHVCLGSYSILGKASGFYARISQNALINSTACDLGVIIEND